MASIEHYPDLVFRQSTGEQLLPVVNSLLYRVTNLETKYPQDVNSASARSDTDLWNHINQYIWGHSGEDSSPKGTWQENPEALNKRFSRHVTEMEKTASEAQAHRATIENKIDNTNEEIQDIHTKLTNLGQAGGDSGLGGLFGGLSIGAIAALGLGLYIVTRKK